MTRKISGREDFEKSEFPVVQVGENDFEAKDGYFPVGYRYLYHLTASRACHPKLSYFMRENQHPPSSQLEYERNIVDQHRVVDYSGACPENIVDHMIWAAKNESWNLQILKIVFVNKWDEFKHTIRSTFYANPSWMSKDQAFRSVWFFAELLTGKRVDLPDLPTNIEAFLLLNPSRYIVGPCYKVTNRQRLYNNLTGNEGFFPTARNTHFAQQCQKAHPPEQIQKALLPYEGAYTVSQIQRAANYVRQKETRATFKIENEEESVEEQKAWLKALKEVHSLPLDTVAGYRDLLDRLKILDRETLDKGWRDHEVFIGSSKKRAMFGSESAEHVIHHIGAAKADLPDIMGGFLKFLKEVILFANTKAAKFEDNFELLRNWKAFDVVALTGMLTLSFTLIHPLPDGNGRVHRLLVHYILERTGYCDMELFPISPVIAEDNKKTGRKDKVLASYSKPILQRSRYKYSESQGFQILNRTDMYYQAMDATMMVEHIHHLIETTRAMFRRQVAFIAAYDEIVEALGYETDSRERKGARIFLSKSFPYLDDQNKAYSSNTKKDLIRKYNWSLEQLATAADISTKHWKLASSPVEVVSLGFPSMRFLDGHGLGTVANLASQGDEPYFEFSDEEKPLTHEH